MPSYAMIPARAGSERLKDKNLLKIKGKPVISYGIEIAKKAGCFDLIVLNSDSHEFRPIAEEHGIQFYLRDREIAQSKTTSDEVVYDFFQKFSDADEVVWINAISPMQDPGEIAKALTLFKHNNLDSMIASHKYFRHGLLSGIPLNFKLTDKFARTQDLEPIELLSYTFMIWRRSEFLKSYLQTGSAITCGKFATYPIDYQASLAIKDASDYNLIKMMMEG